MSDRVVVERVIDVPRAIVEDAFTDPELAEGWYHPTRMPALGSIFTLAEVPGGTRGSSTLVRVTAPASAQPRALVIAECEYHLDLLENLLRGHPVDWSVALSDEHGLPNCASC